MKQYVIVWLNSLTGIFKEAGYGRGKGAGSVFAAGVFLAVQPDWGRNVRLEKFVQLCGGIGEVFRVPDKDIGKLEGISPGLKKEILKTRDISRLEEEYNKLSQRGITFIGQSHRDFPQKLKSIPGCPFGLFLYGTFPREDKPVIAIVGARNATVLVRRRPDILQKH